MGGMSANVLRTGEKRALAKTGKATINTALWEDVADVLIAEERGFFEVIVFEKNGDDSMFHTDLGPFPTPGEGLDAAIAWCHQRGLKILLPMLTVRKLNNG